MPEDVIRTGFEEHSDEHLINYDSSDITTGDRAKMEMDRRLKKSIDNFNRKASKQTTAIIFLTIAILITSIAQIGLFLYSIFTKT